jgi:Putative transposase
MPFEIGKDGGQDTLVCDPGGRGLKRAERQRVITLTPHEFIRRFLLHVLPHGFHRIRHYGLLASSARKASIARARELLAVAPPPQPVEEPEPLDWLPPCLCCGGRHDLSVQDHH